MTNSVWDELAENTAEATVMKFKSKLMMAVKDWFRASGMTEKNAAIYVQVSVPRFNSLIAGKIHAFSLEALINILSHAGFTYENIGEMLMNRSALLETVNNANAKNEIISTIVSFWENDLVDFKNHDPVETSYREGITPEFMLSYLIFLKTFILQASTPSPLTIKKFGKELTEILEVKLRDVSNFDGLSVGYDVLIDGDLAEALVKAKLHTKSYKPFTLSPYTYTSVSVIDDVAIVTYKRGVYGKPVCLKRISLLAV